jgi:hypothetical protein
MRFGDHEIIDVEIVIVLGVRNRALQRFPDLHCNPLLRKLEIGQRHRHLLAADQLRHEIEFARAGADHAQHRLRLIVLQDALALCLAHGQTLFALRSPEWP